MSQGDTHSALIELDVVGVVMRPGQQPPNRNTSLAVVARNASRPILSDDQVAEIEKQGKTGKLSLADGRQGKDFSTICLGRHTEALREIIGPEHDPVDSDNGDYGVFSGQITLP